MSKILKFAKWRAQKKRVKAGLKDRRFYKRLRNKWIRKNPDSNAYKQFNGID